MSAQNALQLATAIQSKVGSSLIGVQNMLPPAEANSAILQAGAGTSSAFLLSDMIKLQQDTLQSINNVGSVLKAQLDLAEEAERRARDQVIKNQPKPGAGGGVPVAGGGDGGLDDEQFEELSDKLGMQSILTAGLGTALLTKDALKNFGKKLGGKLLKGGIYGAIAGYVADPIVDYVNKEFDLELDKDAKQEIKMSMIGAGVGFGVAGIPGAIIGATVPMIAKVAQYIGGSLNADEISDADFAGAAIGTGAAAMFTASKLGGVFAGSAIPKVATFGAALGSLPVLIGIGAAVAVGAGAMFIAKKVDEYQEMALKKLGETTAKLDKEMGEWAAREEEGLFERFGINLGQLSALGEAQVAAAEANEQAGQNITKFTADTATQTKLTALVDTIANYSDDALRTILMDNTKAGNFFSTIESLKAVAAKGGFGEESGAVFTKLAAFSDRVQNYAKKLVDSGVDLSAKGNQAARNLAGIGGDQLENIPQLEQQKIDTEKELQSKKLELEQAKKDLIDAETRNTGKFFDTKEVNDLQAIIRKLEFEVGTENRRGTLESKILMIDKRLQKFGTTNGLLYNLDQLREIMPDSELRELIKRSVNQQGSQFLQEQSAANNRETTMVAPITFMDNKKQINSASATTIAGKLSTQGDNFHENEYRNAAFV